TTVTVIDGATNNTTNVAVGTDPFAVAVNPVTNQIYVVNGGSVPMQSPASVTVIDGATNNTTTIACPGTPWSCGGAVAVNSVTNQIYVANPGGGVMVIDGATNNTTTVAVGGGGGPSAVAVNSVTNQIYEVNNIDTVTVIDGATNTTLPVAAGTTPCAELSCQLGLAVNPNTNQIYVANPGSANVTVIDGNAPWSADFVVLPSRATITAGQSGTITLTVMPLGSFTSPISFSCTGLPALAGCTFTPASVTPNSSDVTTTLTITTAAPTASLAPPFGRRSSPLYAIWLVVPAMLLGPVGMAVPKRRKLLSYSIVFLLVSGCLLQVACNSASNSGSGSGGGGGGGTGGTPAGTYTVTVTGAAGATQHTTTVTLTVQ
ncbi:MAG: YncE family protein, partial [Candidatus Sulfotelmatobacter sp.]